MPPTSKILFHKHVLFYLVGFVGLRVASFVLIGHDVIQALIVFAILLTFGAIYHKNQELAFLLLLSELLLGGSGHMLEFFGLSLRTVLFLCFSSLWFFHHLTFFKSLRRLYITHHIYHLLSALAIVIALSASLALYSHHPFSYVVADVIPYLYFIFILPLYHLQHNTSHQTQALRLLGAFIIGNAMYSLTNFIIFSGGFAVIQSPYYKWLRDVNMAKITDMSAGFFRIVMPEHLLLLPILLVLMALAMHHIKRKSAYLLIFLTSFVLVLNLSRTFFLAIAVSSLFLLYRHSFAKWAKVVGITAAMFLLTFFGVSLVASGGTSFGLDIFSQRIQSFVDPSIEESTFTRMMLLPPIFELIKTAPLTGVGLGATLEGRNTVTYEAFSTRHMDWGYFEMLAEIGLIGTFIYLSLIIITIRGFVAKIKAHKHHSGFYVGMLAGLIALLTANLTSPALFHVYGIIFIVTAMSMLLRPYHILDYLFPAHD